MEYKEISEILVYMNTSMSYSLLLVRPGTGISTSGKRQTGYENSLIWREDWVPSKQRILTYWESKLFFPPG